MERPADRARDRPSGDSPVAGAGARARPSSKSRTGPSGTGSPAQASRGCRDRCTPGSCTGGDGPGRRRESGRSAVRVLQLARASSLTRPRPRPRYRVPHISAVLRHTAREADTPRNRPSLPHSERAEFRAMENSWRCSSESALMPAAVVQGKPKTHRSMTPSTSSATSGAHQPGSFAAGCTEAAALSRGLDGEEMPGAHEPPVEGLLPVGGAGCWRTGARGPASSPTGRRGACS